MRPSFHARLVNGPFEDPGLFIPFLFQKRAILFDLGDINCLPARDVLKISHAFVTHTHMDHFIGFDRLLRIVLGREKKLSLFGPEGFLRNVEAKLGGYKWNLVHNYNYPLGLQVTEINDRNLISRQYSCSDGFLPAEDPIRESHKGIIYEEPAFAVRAVILDHSIPCLGLSIKEHFHVNIKKTGLHTLGLEPGPWLGDFKQALYSQAASDSKFRVKWGREKKEKQFILGDLTNKIARITPGQKISYITDVANSKDNRERIIELVKNSNHLFIESAFMDIHREIAKRKNHLTAYQAGKIAASAGVKDFTVFHFSPRYTGLEKQLRAEARAAYEAVVK
jgi:ribonuclease Z